MNQQLYGILLATIGVFVMSFDSLLVRLAEVPGGDVAVWRGFFIACTLLTTLVLRPYISCGKFSGLRSSFQKSGWTILLIGITQGVSSFLFPVSLTYTSVADTLFILSASPMCAALLSRIVLRERLPIRTLLAIIAVMFGIGIIVLQGGVESASIGSSLIVKNRLLGDLLAAIIAFTLAATFVSFRRFPQIDTVAALFLGGCLTSLFALPLADPFCVPLQSLLWILLLGGMVLPLASFLLGFSSRLISAPEVSLILVLESILGSFLVFLFLGESPSRGTLIGGGVVICSLVTHFIFALRTEKNILIPENK